MNILERAIDYVTGVDEAEERPTTQMRFGPRRLDSDGNANDQWRYGANRMTDMACKVADELSWWYDEEDEQFVVRNSDYEMERREDELWRAMWILERDIRIEHGSKCHNADERGVFPPAPEPTEEDA